MHFFPALTAPMLLVLQVGALVQTTYNAVAKVDNYDKGTPGALVDNTAGGFINYNAWVYSPLVAGAPVAPSTPNVISTGLRSQTLEGQPAFLPLNSTVRCFDMKSIRNGCVVNSQAGVAGVGVSCTVQISARSAITGLTSVIQAVYNPNLLNGAAFNTTKFPALGFTCINRVDFALLNAPVVPSSATIGTGFDDFSYVAYVAK